MKTEITLEIETGLLEKVCDLAATRGCSLDDLVAHEIQEMMSRRKDYLRARRSALAMLKKGYNLHWTPPDCRDDLYRR